MSAAHSKVRALYRELLASADPTLLPERARELYDDSCRSLRDFVDGKSDARVVAAREWAIGKALAESLRDQAVIYLYLSDASWRAHAEKMHFASENENDWDAIQFAWDALSKYRELIARAEDLESATGGAQ
jgi:hypothetical protein